jgi:hypothetical protein
MQAGYVAIERVIIKVYKNIGKKLQEAMVGQV